jgi:5-methyltetrahydropteroyltriglutamate--homocysteine methyltransferase
MAIGTHTATARSDVVGSLLRPAYLKEARQAVHEGRMTDEQLRPLEDRAVREAIALQEAAGLDVITDGELRRQTWIVTVPLYHTSHYRAPISGFSFVETEPGWMGLWKDSAGNPMTTAPVISRPLMTAPLRVERDIVGEEYAFLKAHARVRTKYTFPAPSWHRVFWHPVHSRDAYPTPEDLLIAVRDYIREHVVRRLRELGCDYIQLDAPNYAQWHIDPSVRAAIEAEGRDLDAELAADAEIDNSVFEGISGITRAIHICRGNGTGGRWFARGGYDRIAVRLFPRLTNYDRLLLEYDSERAGDFTPLRHVLPQHQVVLGLITTKRGTLENEETIMRRIREAAQFVPMERLALSPQCGFSSGEGGNPITPADQEAKLRLLVRVARAVWGA